MKKYLLSIMIFFQIVLLSLGVGIFSLEKTNITEVVSASQQVQTFAEQEEVPQSLEAPQNLEDLHEADDAQLDAWVKNLSHFDGREYSYVTSTKSQGTMDICWAYAAVAAAETSILREGIDTTVTKDTLDLDEILAAYTCNNRDGTHDPLMLTTNDTFNFSWNHGGYAEEALLTMTQGYTLVDQISNEKLGAGNRSEDLKNMVSESKYFVQSYSPVSKNTEAIKRAVLQYGAVIISYRAADYNQHLFYSNGTATNHASIIVGWDDNIEKEKFGPDKPTENGAWIVKNSWGEYGNAKNGAWCYYLSYQSYLGGALVMDLALKEDYPNLYYYDGRLESSSIFVADAVGAIYEAKLSTSTEKEQLKAVAVGFANSNVDVRVEAYRHLNVNPGNVNDKINIPVQGEPVEVKEAHFDHKGFYTIDFDRPIDLEQGEYFSVVVSGKDVYNGSLEVWSAVDGSASTNDMTYHCYNGEWTSYKGSSDVYADNSPNGQKTARLRAITKTVPRTTNLGNDLQYARVEIANRLLAYEKDAEQIPQIRVYFGDKLLQAGQDYTVTLSNNKIPGRATVEIEGKNNYHGTRTTTFEVAKAKYPPGWLSEILYVYKNITRLYQVLLPDDWEWVDEDCDIDYIGLSSYKFSVRYIGDDKEYYQNDTCKVYVDRINQDPPSRIDISDASVEIVGEFKYTGFQIFPTVNVTYGKRQLNLNLDFTLSFENNINAGNEAIVVVSGKGQYTGEKREKFTILKAGKEDINLETTIHCKTKFKDLSEVGLPKDFVWDKNSTPEVVSENVIKAKAIYIGTNYELDFLEFTIIIEEENGGNYVIWIVLASVVVALASVWIGVSISKGKYKNRIHNR